MAKSMAMDGIAPSIVMGGYQSPLQMASKGGQALQG